MCLKREKVLAGKQVLFHVDSMAAVYAMVKWRIRSEAAELIAECIGHVLDERRNQVLVRT